MLKKIIIMGIVVGGIVVILASNSRYQEPVSTSTPAEILTPTQMEAVLPTQFTMTVPETDGNVTISPYTGNTVEFGDFQNNPEEGYGTVTMKPQFLEKFNGGYVGAFAVNYGGSGEMIYVGYFEQGEASFQLDSSVLLGDRVDVSSVEINGEDVIITYYEHGQDQAMAEAPNVEVTAVYTIVDGQFVEVSE